MKLEFLTFDQWDDHLWDSVRPIYNEAFAEKGAKPEKIIRNMFRKQLCFLHIGLDDGRVAAMSLTGKLKEANSLLIDYFAVKEELRGQSFGTHLLKYIEDWAMTSEHYNSLIIEVEAEETPENQARAAFWKRSGFVLTEYIHQYIWVPEPYQAMYKKLRPDTKLSTDGKILFTYIGQFHKESFQR
ncbi:GNAT family N-acetyltransferase [Neobacillus cucumis]|uniref:GNAT family N-acetyltransferase n=1 Tax=Neobacillus cucumis TaxID=1740721 RepID=UPI00203DD008|nr:GNAT family N-acetyltransferase [Neobacillus cucumis]MCM3727561.1 GNAT family N-acetyltransferase [Neobacillus cucumis]